jgi:hypothetical protein
MADNQQTRSGVANFDYLTYRERADTSNDADSDSGEGQP